MKTKQNFFDHLDGGWGDLIADTYEEYNNIMFYDTHRDINLILTNQHNPRVYKYQVNYYEEDYKAQDKDKVNYKIDLTLYMANTNELKLSVAIQNIDVVDSINDNYMKLSFYVDEERTVKDNHSSEIIMIEHNFIRSFLRRAKPYIKLDKDNNTNSSTELYDKFTNDAINLIQDPNMD